MAPTATGRTASRRSVAAAEDRRRSSPAVSVDAQRSQAARRRQEARCARRHSPAPPSRRTSPSSISVRARRSSAAWAPVTTITCSAQHSTPRATATYSAMASRRPGGRNSSGSSPDLHRSAWRFATTAATRRERETLWFPERRVQANLARRRQGCGRLAIISPRRDSRSEPAEASRRRARGCLRRGSTKVPEPDRAAT